MRNHTQTVGEKCSPANHAAVVNTIKKKQCFCNLMIAINVLLKVKKKTMSCILVCYILSFKKHLEHIQVLVGV